MLPASNSAWHPAVSSVGSSPDPEALMLPEGTELPCSTFAFLHGWPAELLSDFFRFLVEAGATDNANRLASLCWRLSALSPLFCLPAPMQNHCDFATQQAAQIQNIAELWTTNFAPLSKSCKQKEVGIWIAVQRQLNWLWPLPFAETQITSRTAASSAAWPRTGKHTIRLTAFILAGNVLKETNLFSRHKQLSFSPQSWRMLSRRN